MKTFQYTVSGFIPYGNREVIAGDELDFPITSEIAGTPATIRTVVLSVVDTIVDEVAGHTYDIQYDETLLGGNLLALDPCCDVGMPTAVTTDLLLEEHVANAPFVQSEGSTVDNSPTLVHTSRAISLAPNGGNVTLEIDPYALLVELGAPDPNDYNFSLQIDLSVTHDENTNGGDSYGVYRYVGQTSNGSTVFTLIESANPLTHISVTQGGGILQALVRNDDPLFGQVAQLQYRITAFKR